MLTELTPFFLKNSMMEKLFIFLLV